MPQCQEEIKGPFANGLSRVVMYDGGVWDMQNSATRPVTHVETVMYPTVIGLRAAVGGSAAKSDWLGALGPADGPPVPSRTIRLFTTVFVLAVEFIRDAAMSGRDQGTIRKWIIPCCDV